MPTARPQRALVRTRPLGQGNYGGILQAYALQQALALLGVDATTDVSLGVPCNEYRRIVKRLRSAVKKFLVRMGSPIGVRESWVADAVRPMRDQQLVKFISDRIRTVSLYDDKGKIDPSVLSSIDLFVTGSDQVWRAAFGRVSSYLFDFLDLEDTRPRIAYAASFGTDEDEYSNSLISTTRILAQHLTAVSVREASGVDIARRLWGVEATHVADPTVLLDRQHYSDLAESAVAPYSTGRLVSYVLDPNEHTREVLDLVSRELELPVATLLPDAPLTYRAYTAHPTTYDRPGVEAWLRAIRDAEFVVTDSFHGTVFSILFNRPFVTIANRSRGQARFQSLLETFSLESRAVSPGAKLPVERISSAIDWNAVNAKLLAERTSSFKFLQEAMGGTV